MIEDKQDELDLFEIAKVLWDDRKFIGIIVASITFLAIVVSFLLPKTYTSEAVITVVVFSEDIPESRILAQLLNSPTFTEREKQKSVRAILKSEYLIEKAIKDLNLLDEILEKSGKKFKEPYRVAANKLKRNIKVINKEDGAVLIKVDWKDPQTAQKINHSIIKNLRELLKEKIFALAKVNRTIYEQEIQKIEEELVRYEQELQRIEQKSKKTKNKVDTTPLQLKVQRLKAQHEVIAKLLAYAKMQEVSGSIFVEVIDPPSYSEKPSKPRKELIVSSAFISSLMFAIFASLIRHAIKSRKEKEL